MLRELTQFITIPHLEPIRKVVASSNFYKMQYEKTGTDTLVV